MAEVAPALDTLASFDYVDAVISFPGIAAAVVEKGGQRFHELQLQGAGYTDFEGMPRVPFYPLMIAMPTDPTK